MVEAGGLVEQAKAWREVNRQAPLVRAPSGLFDAGCREAPPGRDAARDRLDDRLARRSHRRRTRRHGFGWWWRWRRWWFGRRRGGVECDIDVGYPTGPKHDLLLEGNDMLTAEAHAIRAGPHAREVHLTDRVRVAAAVRHAKRLDVYPGQRGSLGIGHRHRHPCTSRSGRRTACRGRWRRRTRHRSGRGRLRKRHGARKQQTARD